MSRPARPLRRGDSGPRVAAVRSQLRALGVPLDPAGAPGGHQGVFDDDLEQAVRSFQQLRGLTADGLIGPETARALDAARWTLGDRILAFVPGHLVVGDDVVQLQQRLMALGVFSGLVDGVLGPETEHALRELQRSSGIVADGTCGPQTLRALVRLRRTVAGGDAAALRAGEVVRRAGASLAGRVVVIDPAHGGMDPGAIGNGLREADVVLDLATRLEGRLTASGVTALLTRGPDQTPSLAARVAFADEVRADLYICLHCDASGRRGEDAPQAAARAEGPRGVACSFWGHPAAPVGVRGADGIGDPPGSRAAPRAVRSPVGSRLADLVQRELVSRTPLVDLRTHARAWDVLRLTRMPAVQIDLGYLTHPGDAGLLADPAFRDTCAEAVLAAVQRLYLPEDDDAPTGTLFLDDVVARSQQGVTPWSSPAP